VTGDDTVDTDSKKDPSFERTKEVDVLVSDGVDLASSAKRGDGVDILTGELTKAILGASAEWGDGIDILARVTTDEVWADEAWADEVRANDEAWAEDEVWAEGACVKGAIDKACVDESCVGACVGGTCIDKGCDVAFCSSSIISLVMVSYAVSSLGFSLLEGLEGPGIIKGTGLKERGSLMGTRLGLSVTVIGLAFIKGSPN